MANDVADVLIIGSGASAGAIGWAVSGFGRTGQIFKACVPQSRVSQIQLDECHP